MQEVIKFEINECDDQKRSNFLMTKTISNKKSNNSEKKTRSIYTGFHGGWVGGS